MNVASAARADETGAADIPALMTDMGRRARAAARVLAGAGTESKNRALQAAAAAMRARSAEIRAENAKDMALGEKKGLSKPLLDRLLLTDDRIEAMAVVLEDVAALPDPVGGVIAEWERPNGLRIERVRTPLGVIGVIYESRPNVTADAGALCLKAGSAAILRGGSESFHSTAAVHACLLEGLRAANLPEDAVQRVPVRDRAAVGELLRLTEYVDVIVPRGGKSLVARVTEESRVPLFKHLDGLCHVYIDKAADADMAREIAVNAKMRRTSICGAAETLLVDKAAVPALLAPVIAALQAAGCAVRGDAAARAVCPDIETAADEDWVTEYLAPVISVAVVDGVNGAMRHIETYGSNHTECIITDDAETAETFLNGVDSAIVMHNASTQFADGGEFGMGAEIGIATGKLHARGPVGLEQLTSFKYRVRGGGQTRV
ncbi:MAG: glutamate-5-semialdehyde dehydrogenase [Rhodospirillales bacterium]